MCLKQRQPEAVNGSGGNADAADATLRGGLPVGGAASQPVRKGGLVLFHSFLSGHIK